MRDQESRLIRLRYTATGAVAALVAAGAIAATVALADAPSTKKPGNATPPSALAKHAPTSSASAADVAGGKAASRVPGKTGSPPPGDVPQVFFDAVQRLVDSGTITAAEAQAVDTEIRTGRVDTDTLASAGFNRAQLQALQQALENTKRGLAAAAQ
jgi:hypothetical protein